MHAPIEISTQELHHASGAGENHALATGVSTALVIGAATVTAPITATALAASAVITAGLAVYYAVTEEE